MKAAITYLALLYLAIVMIGGPSCKDSAPPAPRNLVIESVQALDQEIKCVPYYTGEGANALHSARCRLADKTFAYCRLAVDMKIMECGPLYNLPSAPPSSEKHDASSSTPTPPPAPVAPPAPAPATPPFVTPGKAP